MADENATIKLIGKSIGGCKIIELLGTGGMGAVFLAEQTSLGKQVALKILDARWAEVPQHAEGFLREARLAARLEDEHIVQIYDVGTEDSHHYIVMQLARGESLKDRLRRGGLGVEETLKIIEGVARGLSVAHRHSIVHRDIKPANLIIGEDGIVKILDFGLARLDEDEGDKAQAQFMGSIAFMAPEQSEYMPIDPRTDIYALGVTAYQCLAGQLPFRGDNNFELLVKHHCELPVAPSVIRRDVPLTVSRVVLKMMAKSAQDRYERIDDLLLDLKLIRRQQLPAAEIPWAKRPLNPPLLDTGAFDAEAVYKEGLKKQREAFRSGRNVPPLRDLLPKLGLKVRKSTEPPLLPASFLEVASGDKRMPVAFAASHSFQPPDCSERLVYAGRFQVFVLDERLVIRIRGQEGLRSPDVQRLYDLLEVLPSDVKRIAVALQPAYEVRGQDIRWVVDTYNILDKQGVEFALIVGSMDNHTTFVNLGIDGHITLELELERTASIGLERLHRRRDEPKREDAEETRPLTPSALALVRQIEELCRANELVEAVRAWRRLVAEGLDRKQLDAQRDLRTELYDKLLLEGQEAFDQDDHDTATERFNLLIDMEPGRFEGHFYKGLLLKSEGKLEYAQAFLTQAILAAPDEADIFYHRAIVRSRVDDLEGALRDLNMALTHNPRLASAYYNRARLHKQMGRSDLMKRDLRLYERLKQESRKNTGTRKRTGTTKPPARQSNRAEETGKMRTEG